MPFTLALLCCLTLAAADESKSKPERITIENLVTADPLPPGYTAVHKEARNGDKLVARQLFIVKEGVIAKALISIEERPITTRPEKVAATKGYVNGTAQAFGKAGLKLVRKSIPDLEKTDFKERFVVDLVYEKPDVGELLVQLQIFFEKTGYAIQILGDTKEGFDEMAKWARSVQAVK